MSAIRIAHDLDNAKYFAIFLELEFCSPTPPIKKLCGITLKRAPRDCRICHYTIVRMRIALKVLAGLAGAYLLLAAGLLAIMCQPPGRFARIIAKLPGPFFGVLPFEPLWSVARGGRLRAGDAAPDFDL